MMSDETQQLMQMVAQAIARLSVVESRVEQMFDDLPEQENSGRLGGGGVWSGYYLFGGKINGDDPGSDIDPITEIEGQYFGINLRTGETAFADEPMNIYGVEEWEWRYVADVTIENEDTENEKRTYTLSNRTCGDIVFRIV
jgi:hypothetical protein